MAWGGYGAGGMGGSFYSDNYNPNAVPGFKPPTPLAQAIIDARQFGHQTSYRLPNGTFVQHVYDPFTGQIKQLINESRQAKFADQVGLMNAQAAMRPDPRDN